MVHAFSFESSFARVFVDCCHCSSRAQRSSVSRHPSLPSVISFPGAAATLATPGSPESSLDKWLSWSIFAFVVTALPWTMDWSKPIIPRTCGGEDRGHSDRHASDALSPESYASGCISGHRAGVLWHPRRILGVVAESASTTKESRRSGDSHAGWRCERGRCQ